MREDITAAILAMYEAIDQAAKAQAKSGRVDQGRRKGITAGKHLDPITQIIKNDLMKIGFSQNELFDARQSCTLPGWFRPSKDWDLLAFYKSNLVSAIELKSISSSFGNNANNRAEESIGSAVDAQEAYFKRLFGNCNIPPVLGYVVVVRDCEQSRSAVSRVTRSQHFDIDPVFKNASYLDRFRILGERLRRKSLYNAVWVVFASPEKREVYEPDISMSYEVFLATIKSGLLQHKAMEVK